MIVADVTPVRIPGEMRYNGALFDPDEVWLYLRRRIGATKKLPWVRLQYGSSSIVREGVGLYAYTSTHTTGIWRAFYVAVNAASPAGTWKQDPHVFVVEPLEDDG